MKAKGFTPVIDDIKNEVGGTAALIYGVMWRYSKMSDLRICTASHAKIAERCGIQSRDTIIKHQKILHERGYITEVGRTNGGTISWACNVELKGEVAFGVSNKSTPPVEKLDSPTIKKVVKKDKTKDLVDGILELRQGKGVDGTWFPPDVSEYLYEFTLCFKRRFKREATKAERGYWIAECREWQKRGYLPILVSLAWQYARDKDIAIKSPRSITFAFDQLQAEDSEDFAKEI